MASPLKMHYSPGSQAETVRDRVLDPEKLMQAQIREIEAQLEQRSDYVPALSPILGVIGMPPAFGCEVVWWEDDLPAVRPLDITDPGQTYDLPRPSITSGELGQILSYTRHFAERTRGYVPIRMTDVQGPLDSAALILGHNNFLAGLYPHPKRPLVKAQQHPRCC
ncbi:MAG: hypothetical protein AB1435_03365 [Chloroflexota bacterium]|jgi:hypothetical protein